ncbi:unnamed protein product [Victoria cruziana]
MGQGPTAFSLGLDLSTPRLESLGIKLHFGAPNYLSKVLEREEGGLISLGARGVCSRGRRRPPWISSPSTTCNSFMLSPLHHKAE